MGPSNKYKMSKPFEPLESKLCDVVKRGNSLDGLSLIGIINPHAIQSEYSNYIDCSSSCTDCVHYLSATVREFCINQEVVQRYIVSKKAIGKLKNDK